jgi:hypothetical protein
MHPFSRQTSPHRSSIGMIVDIDGLTVTGL